MSFKHLLFRHYWWVGMVLATSALIFATFMDWFDNPYVIGGIVASAISFIFIVQRQRLEETRLFKELFTAFNDRYDDLNDGLARLSKDTVLSDDQRQLLIDYFNLCAEEYLFQKEGYIHKDVWSAWCRGMLQYLQLPPVADVWRTEQATRSYYDLSLDVIKEGAQE